MQEEWIKWEQTKHLEQKYQFNSLLYNEKESEWEINLSEIGLSDKKIQIMVNEVMAARKYTGILMKIKIKILEKKYGAVFYQDWAFFVVKNSNFICYLSDRWQEDYESDELIHYVIITQDEIIDLICMNETIVKFLSM